MSGQRVVPIQPPSGPYIVPDYPPSCHTVNTWSNGHQEVIKGPKNWCQMVRYLPTAQVSLERWKINTLCFMSGWCDYWKYKRHSLFCNEKNKQLISFLKALFGLYFWSIYRVFFPPQNLLPHRPLSGFNFFRFSKLWIFLYFFHLVFKGFAIYINVKEDFSPGVIEFWDYSVNSYFYVRHSVRSSLHISPKNLQSGPRVVIMVLNTQCYQCL